MKKSMSMDDHLRGKQTTVDDQTTMDENVEQKNKQLPSKPKACLQVNFNGRLEEFKGPRVLRHDAKEHRSHFEDANPN